MKSYAEQQRKPTDYLVAAAVALLALALVGIGLNTQPSPPTQTVRPPMHTVILPPAPPAPKPTNPPPPPPPASVAPPPVFVPPPKLNLPAPKPPPIRVSHQKAPPHPPKAAAAPSNAAPGPTDSTSTKGAPGGTKGGSTADHAAGAVPINNVRPEYPQDAQEENREGAVTASCDILATGKPAHCRILSVKGGRDFAESAMQFLEHSAVRYQPAVVNGQPVVEHNHVLHLDFTLSDD
ncbi:energy transducer TonB [Oecophyllibacter saccharovorans]|uniref:Energy transducer TonB n=1 Tax=Oecophyllibacter saccharovorans TaxID=2558360 RepID=A0A506URX5_9PROT|nr:energy transducer TonB [Oecophyllibacter saccharovorans]QDH14961.1 energy transducer TonB [Oecophyllibacter saccharovorans]TPW35147.1 energy transducer TonB [Oecophyllibacter saccharovorans]TPW36097.1 energy transducer TonB [Oecophyllibacter saccharovorans]